MKKYLGGQNFKVLVLGVGVGIWSLLILALISLVAAVPTLFLWNWLMPSIFGIAKIGFFQAWGLNFLTGIFFRDVAISKSSKSSKSFK